MDLYIFQYNLLYPQLSLGTNFNSTKIKRNKINLEPFLTLKIYHIYALTKTHLPERLWACCMSPFECLYWTCTRARLPVLLIKKIFVAYVKFFLYILLMSFCKDTCRGRFYRQEQQSIGFNMEAILTNFRSSFPEIFF